MALCISTGLFAQETEFCYLDDREVDDFKDRSVSWNSPKPQNFQEGNYRREYTAYWIARPEVTLFNCPIATDGKLKKSIGKTAVFGQRFFVSDRAVYYGKDGTIWIQLSQQADLNSTVPVTQGWVKEEDLLLHRTPLTNDKTEISYKAHLVRGELPGSNRVLLRFYPKRESDVIGELFVKRTFYIYDIYRAAPKLASKEEKLDLLKKWADVLGQDRPFAQAERELNRDLLRDVYLLLGDVPTLDSSLDKLGSGLLGWVPANLSRLWSTREALELSGNIPLYENKQLKKRVALSKKALAYRYDTPRHLVLGKDNASTGNAVYRIGTYSKLTPRIVAGALDNITIPIDVLFVLDATRSMKPVFGETKEAIKIMAQELNASAKKQNIPNPYFGLTVYRDSPHPSKTDKKCKSIQEVEPLVDLQEWSSDPSGGSELEKALDMVKAEDCDLDYPESLYLGLYQGVEKVGRKDRFGNVEKGFREGSFRVVIHVGDNGDHGRSGIKLEDVSYLFNTHQINYYPIQVGSDWAGTFFNRSIVQLSHNIAYSRDSVRYQHLKTDEVKNHVIDALRKASSSQEALQSEVRKFAKRKPIVSQGIAGGGEWIDMKVGDRWNWKEHASPQLIAYLQNRNIAVKNAVDLYYEGWIDAEQTFSYQTVVLVEYNKLLNLLTVMKSLINTKPTPKKIAKTWSRILSHLTGDKPCDAGQKLYKCLNQLKGIHFNLGILQYSLDELSKMLQSNRKRFAKLICEAKGKSAIISGVLEEKDYKVNYGIVSGNCKVTSKHLSQRRYWFITGDIRMGWIPLRNLP